MALLDLAKYVAKYAPLVGAALPIPGGEIIGKIVANAFGGDPSNPDDILKKIEADTQAGIKLKSLELEHQEKLTQILFDDRKDARSREIQFIEKTGEKDYTQKNLAYFTTLGFFVILLILFLPIVDLNDQEKNLIMILIGMLASNCQTVINYYFGSSKHSDKE